MWLFVFQKSLNFWDFTIQDFTEAFMINSQSREFIFFLASNLNLDFLLWTFPQYAHWWEWIAISLDEKVPLGAGQQPQNFLFFPFGKWVYMFSLFLYSLCIFWAEEVSIASLFFCSFKFGFFSTSPFCRYCFDSIRTHFFGCPVWFFMDMKAQKN